MEVTVNYHEGLKVIQYKGMGRQIKMTKDVEDGNIFSKAMEHVRKNKKFYLTTAYTLALTALPGGLASAETGEMAGGMNLILLLQKAAFWIGMGVTIWGLIEMGLDAPNWRGRVFKGVLLYVGVLLVPLVFLELQNSLQVDVWDQLNKGGE